MNYFERRKKTALLLSAIRTQLVVS
jgi:hypothetical protein